MHYHLVFADSELPNDNPRLFDPCGLMALLSAATADASAVPDDEVVDVVAELPAELVTLKAKPAPAACFEEVPTAPASGEVERLAGIAELEGTDRGQAPVIALTGSDHVDADDEEPIEIVDELEPVEFEIVEPAATPDADQPGDPFATFVQTLVAVAQDAGCARAAALLPALLEGGHVEAAVMGEPTIECLVNAGVLARGSSGLVGGEAFRRTAEAWRSILRGDSDDFGACGPRMLDEWAADLVARIVAAPAKTEQLRRELRTRGIAAFGLVMAA